MKPKSEKREILLSVIKQVNDMLSYTLPVLRSKRVILPYLLKIPSSSRWTFQRWRDIRFICAFSFISIQPNGSVQLLTYSAHRFRDTTNKECHGCRYRSKQRWRRKKVCMCERKGGGVKKGCRRLPTLDWLHIMQPRTPLFNTATRNPLLFSTLSPFIHSIRVLTSISLFI